MQLAKPIPLTQSFEKAASALEDTFNGGVHASALYDVSKIDTFTHIGVLASKWTF